MKKIIYLFVFFTSLIINSQNSNYKLTSYIEKGFKAPNKHYIGEAWLNRLLKSDNELPFGITKATFKANSTLDWHYHTSIQVLVVIEGEGYYQEKYKDPIRIKAGDVIRCEKEIEHWHASSKEKDVTYLALYGGNKPTVWTEVLSQEAYDKVADILRLD